MCHVWTNLRSCSTEPLAYCDVNHRSDLSVESSIHLTRKWEVVADYIKVITHDADKSNTCANIQNPAHEKWIKLSAVRGGDVHLKTATESSVNPSAHWASSRNRNIMMLAVVLGCNNQSLQGFFLGGCCSLKCLILWFEVFYCRGIAGKQEIHMHGNSVGNKDQRTLFSEVDVALRANRALWW